MPVLKEIVTFGNRVAVFMAGRSKRDYKPLFEDQPVNISGQTMPLNEGAKKPYYL